MQKVIIVTVRPHPYTATNLVELNHLLTNGWKVISVTPVSQRVSAGTRDYQLSGATFFSYVIEKAR